MKFLKLRGRIKEKGFTEQEFANMLSLSRTSLSLRMNGKTEWSLSDIEKACEILSIPSTEIPEYFFSTYV